METTGTTTDTITATMRKRITARKITSTKNDGMYEYSPNECDNVEKSYIPTSSSLIPHPLHSSSQPPPTKPLIYPLPPPPHTTTQNFSPPSHTTTQNRSPPSHTTNMPGGIRGGRWSPDEHELFLKGLRKHARDWKAVNKFVPSRSLAQIRSHAQNYFKRITHPTSSNPSISGAPDEGNAEEERSIDLSIMGGRYEDVAFWRKVERMVKEPEKVEVEVRRLKEELETKRNELERRIRDRDRVRSSGRGGGGGLGN